jgi:hypothetical protein
MKKEEIKEMAKKGKEYKGAYRGGEFKSAKHQALKLKMKEKEEK